ncbi:MAG: dihydroorotase family protein [Candidatus Thorarchaeota archaeon]
MSVDLLLKDGIVIEDGREVVRSVAIGGSHIEGFYSSGNEPDARRTLDCHEKYVLPGAIDIHVHLRDLNESYKEDYETGTRAAAAGGVTTVVDMPNSNPPVLSLSVLEQKIASATEKRFVNVGFYSGVPKTVTDFDANIASKVLGIKVYPHSPLSGVSSFSQARIESCMKLAAKFNLPLLFHPDSSKHSKISKTHDEFFDLHSCESEIESIRRFITARNEHDVRLHVCHVSCGASTKLIAENRAEMNLTAEVTPHHLFLDSSEIVHEDGSAKMLPPVRSPYDNEVLLMALRRCVIDCIASDHAPHPDKNKTEPFLDAPAGIPGLETTLPLLLTEVFEERMSWVEYLRCYCSGPAKILGLQTKGLLAEGYEADISIVAREEYHIRGSTFHSKAKLTPFEGQRVLARPVMTIVGGSLVYSDGEFQVEPGSAGSVPVAR